MILSLGGCEQQLKGHIQGNLNVGNNKETLLSTVTQLFALCWIYKNIKCNKLFKRSNTRVKDLIKIIGLNSPKFDKLKV